MTPSYIQILTQRAARGDHGIPRMLGALLIFSVAGHGLIIVAVIVAGWMSSCS